MTHHSINSGQQRPLSSVHLNNGSYVLALASLASAYAAASSSPANTIHLYDKSNISKQINVLSGHSNGITCLRTASNFVGKREVLMSCGRDGAMKIWDERSDACAVQMSAALAKSMPLLCCDSSPDGLTVAAGTELVGEDALILYWDPRNPASPIRKHSSTHSDDITALHYLQSASSEKALLSASTDGLISISNPDEYDEDEANTHVANWGCSVSKVGWINKSTYPSVWATSDMETLSFWSHELDTLHDLDRNRLSASEEHSWQTDYIIDVCTSVKFGTYSFVGSNTGDIAMFTLPLESDEFVPRIKTAFKNHHKEIIRSVIWDDENNILLSGGEDSVINAWSIPTDELHESASKISSRKRADDNYSMEVDTVVSSEKL